MNIAVTELKKPKRTVRTPHINIRVAEASDAAVVARFLGLFFGMSQWANHLEYDEEKARSYLAYTLNTPHAMYVIAFDKDEIVGVCSYHVFNVFTDPLAVMDETFTIPRYRRTDLGRRLVAMALTLAKVDGCGVMNFPICSGMKEQNSLMNMVERHFGATPVGTIYRKDL